MRSVHPRPERPPGGRDEPGGQGFRRAPRRFGPLTDDSGGVAECETQRCRRAGEERIPASTGVAPPQHIDDGRRSEVALREEDQGVVQQVSRLAGQGLARGG